MIGIGVGAAVALGGVLLKGIGRKYAEKGVKIGAKKVASHLDEKGKGKESKISKLLKNFVGMSNEEIAILINEKSDEVQEAMITGTKHLDETSEGLLEMTRQIEVLMENYQGLGHDDKEFIQSLKDAVNPDFLAEEIVESMKRYQGEGLKIEEITGEIGGLFSEMGWDDKFDQVQSSLNRMEEDIKEILDRTGNMADDLSDIKGKLKGDRMGKKKTKIADSVMTRSNVITAGEKSINIAGSGKYIGDGAVNIEGENVNYTNIDAKALSQDDWKDILSNAIKDIGIGADLERDISSYDDERRDTYADLAVKFKEVDSLYDNMEMESDVFLRMGNALYLSGDYKKSYDCYMKAFQEKKAAARANMAFMFSDKNFRDRLLREVGKATGQIQLSLKELYRANDLRTYRMVKVIQDELSMFEKDVRASVEGIVKERDRRGSLGGINEENYGAIAAFYEEIYSIVNSISGKTEQIQNGILMGNSSGVGDIAAPIRAEVQQLRNRYKDRMSIIADGI